MRFAALALVAPMPAVPTPVAARSTDGTGMTCEVTSTARSGRCRVVTTHVTDPARDAVVLHVSFQPRAAGLRLPVRLDGSVNGNGGGGTANGGADSATASRDGLVQTDANTVSNATNRDYAVPTAMAGPATGYARRTVVSSALPGPAPLDPTATSPPAQHGVPVT